DPITWRNINSSIGLTICLWATPLVIKLVALVCQIYLARGLGRLLARALDWIMNVLAIYWFVCIQLGFFTALHALIVVVIGALSVSLVFEGLVLVAVAVLLTELAIALFHA